MWVAIAGVVANGGSKREDESESPSARLGKVVFLLVVLVVVVVMHMQAMVIGRARSSKIPKFPAGIQYSYLYRSYSSFLCLPN